MDEMHSDEHYRDSLLVFVIHSQRELTEVVTVSYSDYTQTVMRALLLLPSVVTGLTIMQVRFERLFLSLSSPPLPSLDHAISHTYGGIKRTDIHILLP